jgi:hypothetical protein
MKRTGLFGHEKQRLPDLVINQPNPDCTGSRIGADDREKGGGLFENN